jgi:hypothetical protein
MTDKEKTIIDELKGTANQIKEQVERLIKEGNARRVIVKNDEGKILFESQLTIGVAGSAVLAFSAPIITALSAVLLYATNYRVYLVRVVSADVNTSDSNTNDSEASNPTTSKKRLDEKKKASKEVKIEIQ